MTPEEFTDALDEYVTALLKLREAGPNATQAQTEHYLDAKLTLQDLISELLP